MSSANFRRLWITCVSFGVIGVGAALSVTPIYADILRIGRYMCELEIRGVVYTTTLDCLDANRKRLEVDQDLESLTGVVSGIVSAAPSLG